MLYFGRFSIITVVCLIITGCAGRFAQPPRETITFDYVPTAEAPPGSANVTFAIVGAKFIVPNFQSPGPVGSVSQPNRICEKRR